MARRDFPVLVPNKHVILFALVLWLCVHQPTHGAVFTSMEKIEQMVMKEADILNGLHVAVLNLGKVQIHLQFSDFYVQRMAKVDIIWVEQPDLDITHPNAAYQCIMDFYHEYEKLRNILEGHTSQDLDYWMAQVASVEDVIGARRSLLRIQSLHRLTTTDMIRGDYLGIEGPSLTSQDAFDIGQQAFQDGQYNASSEWLEMAMVLRQSGYLSNRTAEDMAWEIIGKCLLARAYLRLGQSDISRTLLTEILTLGDANSIVLELKHELEVGWAGKRDEGVDASTQQHTPDENGKKDNNNNTIDKKGDVQPHQQTPKAEEESHICAWNVPKGHNYVIADPHPALRCNYRPSVPAYNRFKQEVLSLSPFVALFYEVVNDTETHALIDQAKKQLERSRVLDSEGERPMESRTSEVSFLWDHNSETAARVSRRLGAMTSLRVHQDPTGEYAGEPLQVGSYGLGGHYAAHFDTFSEPELERLRTKNGNRMATMLIYLSEVKRGGGTAFPKVGILVKPVKGTAVFWYSMDPSGERDVRTLHSGCPVVVGHKWVSNKWIWSNGNMMSRRCGLKEAATQAEIEDDMIGGWR